MITWSLENAIDTSDSMKSRGYGLKGRTSFSIYKFTSKDAYCVSTMLAEIITIIFLISFGSIRFRYYPTVKGNLLDMQAIIFYIIYFIFLLTPMIINVGEGIKWKLLKSAI